MALLEPASPDVRFAGTSLRHSKRPFWQMIDLACKAAAFVHVAFGTLFAILGLWAMVAVNTGSVLLYIGALALLRRRRNQLAATLVWLEIVAHAIVAVGLLGLDSGFHYYLLVMLPFIIVGPDLSGARKVAIAGILLAIYLALDLTMHRVAPAYAAPAVALDGLRIFNTVATFVLLGRLAHVYNVAVRRAEDRLRVIASTDPLTGALNRRSLLDLADRLVDDRLPFAIVMADVDHFKAVNDTHGHECGDRVLMRIHLALRDAVRPEDEVARWGGEEFVLLLKDVTGQDASAIAERARRAVESLRIPSGDDRSSALETTMTFGIAIRLPGETPEACIARADAALYDGKTAGRNRVVVVA